ncbi:hypothetical protein CLOM_g24175 [Closterium sp. NIES-68]|nr:hypothetical protein CLOM_g24175 [Closterium sp. NIES-68]
MDVQADAVYDGVGMAVEGVNEIDADAQSDDDVEGSEDADKESDAMDAKTQHAEVAEAEKRAAVAHAEAV